MASGALTLPHRLRALLVWLLLGAVVGALCGVASALFLWLLEHATRLRSARRELVWALPVAGLLIGWVCERFGAAVQRGSSLIIDTIHDDGPEIPLRLAPMVLLGTVLTHLFGGSAGREGTAVQVGASLTDFFAQRARLPATLRRQLLAAGVAGGFGSVFGTPLAGAVFGLELVVLGRIEYGALVPAIAASLVGDAVTRSLGILHTAYPQVHPLPLSPLLLAKWVLFAAAIALVAAAFIELVHWLKRHGERLRLPLRMAAGGLLVLAMWRLVGTDDYLGLGIPGILRAFSDPRYPQSAFAGKLLFTAVTLGAGFLGGEVTPLFFIGAAAGNLLGRALGIPLELAAGVGMAATFAAAANTPLALSLMAVELLGASTLPHVVIVSALAYWMTGQRSIYAAQLRRPKA
ncbi:MAG: chloride channel protein [Myxococcales bacterium]|nr:MAG: chloride channel protein [Myxococcales bacterium]